MSSESASSTEVNTSTSGSASESLVSSTTDFVSSTVPTGPSLTFPSFTPTRTRGSNDGGGGGGGGGGGNAFASSAATNLYLYTFLATLVLLLLVSGAVVGRSITLRVRARRALEESIRNGTYVPPASGLNVSNAPKPRFHDVRINDKDSGSFGDEKRARWVDLAPVAASFVPSTSPHLLPQPATSAAVRPRGSLGSRLRNLNPFRAVQMQDILDELASRDLHLRLSMQQQTPHPTQAELADAAFRSPPTDDSNADEQITERPSAVRVAVLIAMPDPARPINNQHIVQDDASSSSASSTKGKVPASGAETKPDDEVEVPYVEFGVAEVPLASVAPSRPRSASPSSSSVPPPISTT